MSEIVEGKNPVFEALRSGRPLNKIYLSKSTNFHGAAREIITLAKEKGIPVVWTERKKINQLSHSDNHQGVVAIAAPHTYTEVENLLGKAERKKENPFLIILDGVEDPHNLGAILRSAEASGSHGIIVPKRRAAGLTATVTKVSAGAIEYVPVARVANISATIENLKEKGLWIIGLDPSGKTNYTQATLTDKIALVIGGEGKGLSRLVKEKCDFLVNIPMAGKIASLNTSVAAAIIMYEVYRQRSKDFV